VSLKKKVLGVALTLGVLSGFSSIALAAENQVNDDLVFKQQKIKSFKNIDDTFKKKSHTLTVDEIKNNEALKEKITPKALRGPKGEPQPDWSPGDSFGNPTGTNNISFTSFDSGDIILVHDGNVAWGYYRHAGMWDSDFYNGSISDLCVWEANVSPSNDVHRASPSKFRGYDTAIGLYVPSATTTQRYNTTMFAAQQNKKPYSFTSSKTDYSKFYCSKLVWAAYKEKASKDLDYDGGLYVYPDDLFDSTLTSVFAEGY
jgi:uncharacterized protein YycO